MSELSDRLRALGKFAAGYPHDLCTLAAVELDAKDKLLAEAAEVLSNAADARHVARIHKRRADELSDRSFKRGEALWLILSIAEGSTTANSLPHIAKIARATVGEDATEKAEHAEAADTAELLGKAEILHEWAERLQSICTKYGALGGDNRLDFIERTLDAKDARIAELEANQWPSGKRPNPVQGFSGQDIEMVWGSEADMAVVKSAMHSLAAESDLRTNLRHWREECGKVHSQLSRMRSESADALKPFASIAATIAEFHPGWDHDQFTMFVGSGENQFDLPLAPFRAARALYAKLTETSK